MTAKEALEKSDIKAKELYQERLKREAEAAKEKVRKEKEAKAQFEKSVKSHLTHSLQEIEAAVNKGSKSVVLKFGGHYEMADRIQKELEKLGYTFKDEDYHVDADSGDRDSGEGRCDAHWVYNRRAVWGKEAAV